MKGKKYLAAAVTASFLTMGYATVSWAENVVVPADKVTEAQVDTDYVVDSQIADVTGDQINDKIYLIGQKRNKDSIYASKLRIVIKDENDQPVMTGSLDQLGGYEAKLFIGDFNGDHINDVMVTAATGGSGGITEHRIATFTNGSFNVIFGKQENQGIKITGDFLDGFKAELQTDFTSKKIIIDNSTNKESYIRIGIYDSEGKLLKQQKPYANPFGKLEPIDINKDGVFELKGYQRVVGAYNADSLADIETIWQYQDHSWQLKQIKAATYLLNEPITKIAAN